MSWPRAMAAAALLLCAGCALVPLKREPLPPEAERLTTRTGDGWELAMVRYRPRGEPSGPPVLLCHGISATGRHLDLDAEHSMARWLAARGREAFTLSLRGGGDSDHADPEHDRSWQYSMDTLATQDLPAAIAKVRELTGAARIDYVGHSMGGLLGYIYLARGGPGLNAAVILGSPVGFIWGGRIERAMLRFGPALATDLQGIDVPTLARAMVPRLAQIESPVDVLLYNPDNVSPATWQRMLGVGVATISGGVLRQFLSWLERDAMLSDDGQLDYLRLLGEVRVPMFVVAGKLDRIAPVAAVKAGYDAAGGPKEFFIAGEENGLAHDYGHMDLVIGDYAAAELWPRALSFLERHGSRAGSDALSKRLGTMGCRASRHDEVDEVTSDSAPWGCDAPASPLPARRRDQQKCSM